MVRRFVAVGILADHACAEDRQRIGRFGVQGEHFVQPFFELLRAAHQPHQPFDVLLHGPQILPTVAFGDVFRIGFRIEIRHPFAVREARLHEARSGLEHVHIVFRAHDKFVV